MDVDSSRPGIFVKEEMVTELNLIHLKVIQDLQGHTEMPEFCL